MKEPIYIRGMHGMGDCIHQRAVIRQLLDRHEIWLETSWPQIYHDMPQIHLVAKGTTLRTQLKNAVIKSGEFENLVPQINNQLQIAYSPSGVISCGSVLGAMMKCAGVDINKADFHLPIPDAWDWKAQQLIDGWNTDKPIMFFRPLVERKEWAGCKSRNPDSDSYKKLFDSIRHDYFVVSVADLVVSREWLAPGARVDADIEYHSGELDFETTAALMKRSALAFTSPGFATVLALAVDTPVVTVFGGYENSKSFFGDKYLGIDPINSCQCFSHHHACRKEIDMLKATERLKRFINEFADNKITA